jgi:Protein of unknown function (DUF3500)
MNSAIRNAEYDHGLTPARQRPPKALPALVALLFIGVAIYASRAAWQSKGDAEPVAALAEKQPMHTVKAVAAAEAFLATLDEKQKAKTVYDFKSDKRPRWSNLPVSSAVPRNGARMGELTKDQQTAGMAVVAAVLSKEGYHKVLDIIAGDNIVAKGGDKGGKGDKGGGKGGFGFDNFYLAIFGKPSVDQPWLVQFGGHHLAINVTVVGKDFVLTPTLTCAQPASFMKDGKTVRPLGLENDTGFKLINALDEKQRAKAILGNKAINLLLGPGQDGKEIEPAGIKGADLDEKQQALLIELASAWVNILQEDSAAQRMAEIRAKVKDTYFAWYGPTAEGSAAYFRVQGPSVVIEYAPQGTTSHIHTIVREFGNDYGKKLVKR